MPRGLQIRRRASLASLSGLAVCVVVSSAGCTLGRYSPLTLPTEFHARRVQNSQAVDLSRLAMASPPSDVVDVGDVVEVTVAASLNPLETTVIPVRVNERGSAVIPVVGEVSLAGLDLISAEAAIAGAAVQRGLYRSPQVTVTMKQRRLNRVTVVGAVKTPGVYELPRRSSDLLAAITAGGGLAPDAGANVEIRAPGGDAPERAPFVAGRNAAIEATGHSVFESDEATDDGRRGETRSTGRTHDAEHRATGGPRTVSVNLVSATADTPGKGWYVPDGAVVHVEKRTPTPVHVMGLVSRPGQYEYPVTRELRVLDALALAGGTATPVADKVFVIRKPADKEEPVLVQVSIRRAKADGRWNLPLGEGDVVSVEETPATVIMHALQLVRPGVGLSLGGLF